MEFLRDNTLTLTAAIGAIILAVTGALTGEAAIAFLAGSVLRSPISKK